MHAGQKRFLEEHHEAATWRGRSKHANRLVRAFALEGSELRGWTLQRAQRDDGGEPAAADRGEGWMEGARQCLTPAVTHREFDSRRA